MEWSKSKTLKFVLNKFNFTLSTNFFILRNKENSYQINYIFFNFNKIIVLQIIETGEVYEVE